MMMILTFVFWILMGVATAYFANQRGRDPAIWFMVGMLLGVLGLLLLFVLPVADDDAQAGVYLKEEVPEKPETLELAHDSYLINDWFYLDASHQQQGPVSYHVLKDLWKAGTIGERSLVWSEGMSAWQKIEQLPELKEQLELPL